MASAPSPGRLRSEIGRRGPGRYPRAFPCPIHGKYITALLDIRSSLSEEAPCIQGHPRRGSLCLSLRPGSPSTQVTASYVLIAETSRLWSSCLMANPWLDFNLKLGARERKRI